MTGWLQRGPARGIFLVALAAGLLAACDDDPLRGPGTLLARVEAPGVELGSAVVEVRGPGIRGFEGAGSARVFTREQGDGSFRVVAVDPAGGDLVFRIQVEDVSTALPSTVITAAADTANAVVASGVSMTVGLER